MGCLCLAMSEGSTVFKTDAESPREDISETDDGNVFFQTVQQILTTAGEQVPNEKCEEH